MKTLWTNPFGVCRAMLCLVLVGGEPVASRGGGLVAAWGDPALTLLPPGVNDVKALSASFHTLALRSDGTVLGWGSNNWGQADVPAGLPEIRAVAAGDGFSVVLTAGGDVLAWGANYAGQTSVPAGLANVVAISAAGVHALALLADGTVVAWGNNGAAQTHLPPGLSNVVEVACGSDFNLALTADGSVIAWGDNNFGQTNVPPGLSNVVAIAAGGGQSLALKDDGTVVAWGNNSVGQSAVPPGLSNVIAVAAGFYHCLALTVDGSVVAWGSDSVGQTTVPAGLTNAEAIAAGSYGNVAIVPDGPVQLVAQSQTLFLPVGSNVTLTASVTGGPPLGLQWLDNGIPVTNSTRVTGVNSSMLTISNLLINDTGSYRLAASNGYGSVIGPTDFLTVGAPPTFTNRPPVDYYLRSGASVSLSEEVTGGSAPLGYQWIFNGSPIPGAPGTVLALSNLQTSQSGDYWIQATNPFGSASNLVAVLDITNYPPIILSQPASEVVSLGGTATLSVQAIGSPPLSYQWSFNGIDIPGATSNVLKLGPLALDQTGYYDVEIDNLVGTTFSTKALLTVIPVVVWGAYPATNFPPALKNVIALAASTSYPSFLVALQSDGTLADWSENTTLQPILPPPPGSGFISIAAGSGLDGNNAGAALRSDGTVVDWLVAGYDDCNFTRVPTGLTNVVAVPSPGLALKADGTLTGWGCDAYAAAGFTNVVAVAGLEYPELAITSFGAVVSSGNRTNGIPAISNVIAIAVGTYHNLALRADGTVAAWGSYHPLPAGLSNVVAIAAGGASNSLALRADGTLVSDTQGGPPAGLSNVTAIALGYLPVGSGAAAIGTGSPNFTIQPISRIVGQGATVQFHARAVGVQPMQYQWTFNGTNVPGATTGDLTVTNAQPPDTGAYQVTVSNALGTLASIVANLGIPLALQPASSDLTAALDATNLSWGTSFGIAAWFAETNTTHDGVSAGQSGPIGNSQQSVLQTTVSGPGTLTFWWKVSSEEGFDLLSFSVDGAMPVPAISGEVDWEQETVSIAGGVHQLDWIYAKDPTVSVGQDAGWLDQVAFTPSPPVAQLLGAPAMMPNGALVLTASAADGTSIQGADVTRFEAQTSSNLVDWVTLPDAITFTNGALLISDTGCSNASTRFYRVIEHY